MSKRKPKTDSRRDLIEYYLRNRQHFIVWVRWQDGAFYRVGRLVGLNAYVVDGPEPASFIPVTDLSELMVTSLDISAVKAIQVPSN